MARSRPPASEDLDLNLVVLLDALLAERNVTRAAARVGLTQSAASHALRRLREHFGDPLLVRTADGMVLTARARELAAPIHDTLDALTRALRGARAFDPAHAHRTFTLAMGDYLGVSVLPAVYARIARDAPAIDLRVTSITRDVETALQTDAVDLVMGLSQLASDVPGLYQQRLFDDRYVCMVRRGHPVLARRLDLAAYCALDHVLIAPRGGRGVVDRTLASLGRERRIAVQVPHWTVAPHLVATSDLALTVVERFARSYAALLPLAVVALPLDLPATPCWQRWHERSHGDAAHAWLRGVVAEVAAAAAGVTASPA